MRGYFNSKRTNRWQEAKPPWLPHRLRAALLHSVRNPHANTGVGVSNTKQTILSYKGDYLIYSSLLNFGVISIYNIIV